jgi:hypothetical protein
MIRSGGVEVAIDDVLRRRANLSTIGALTTSPGRGSGQTFLSHQTAHYLLRDEDLLPDQCRANPTITVATVIEFEDVRDDATRVSMPVRNQQPCTVIEVRTAGKTQSG